jgi:hypothetical protein
MQLLVPTLSPELRKALAADPEVGTARLASAASGDGAAFSSAELGRFDASSSARTGAAVGVAVLPSAPEASPMPLAAELAALLCCAERLLVGVP